MDRNNILRMKHNTMSSGNYTKVGEFENIYKKVDFASHIITQFNSLIAFHDAIIKNN